jgi:hypothetical protein
MHQSFRLNGSDYYTIFDLPIQVTNSIPANDSRSSCDSLNNQLLQGDQVNATGPPAILPYSVGKIQKNEAIGIQPHFIALVVALVALRVGLMM